MCTLEDDGLACDFSVYRTLALAGYSQLPEISGLGYHFRQFIDTMPLKLESELMKYENGYFGITDAGNMKSNYAATKKGGALEGRMPFISRLFTSSETAKRKGERWQSLVVDEDEQHKKKIKHLTGVFLCSEEVVWPNGKQSQETSDGERPQAKPDGEQATNKLVYTGEIYMRCGSLSVCAVLCHFVVHMFCHCLYVSGITLKQGAFLPIYR